MPRQMKKITELQLRLLIKDVLEESWDLEKIDQFEFKKINTFFFKFNIDKENIVKVKFSNFKFSEKEINAIKSLNSNGIWAELPWNEDNVFNIEFTVNDDSIKAFKTSVSIYYKIIKTVLIIVTQFITNESPELLFIGSIDDKKQHHFDAIIAGQINKIPGWIFSNSKMGTALFKTNNK